MPETKLVLVKPLAEHLPAYVDALERGWSPDTEREETRNDELREIEADAQAFLDSRDDVEGKAGPIIPEFGSSPALRFHIML